MKRLRILTSLVAICGMIAFLTGCGSDNNDNGSTQTASNAPSSLNGNAYALSDAGGSGAGSTLSFDQSANTYTWNRGGTIETGTFNATRNTSNGDIWDVVVIDSGGQPQSNLRLTFGANSTGSFLFQRPGSADVTGTFTLSSGNNGSTTTTGTNTGTTTNTGSNTGTTTNTGTDTGTTTNTGTNTGTTTTTGTDTGTTTNTGTNTGTTTNTGTDTGTTTSTGTTTGTTTGSVQAPAQVSSVSVHTTTSVLAPTSYTINLSGGSAGTFQITGNSTGNGNYTYQANGTTAHLVLTYTGDYLGDYDDMTLIFQGPPGTTEDSHFTGTQKVDQTTGNLAGTFSYLVP